jgi:hypothetical protein
MQVVDLFPQKKTPLTRGKQRLRPQNSMLELHIASAGLEKASLSSWHVIKVLS